MWRLPIGRASLYHLLRCKRPYGCQTKFGKLPDWVSAKGYHIRNAAPDFDLKGEKARLLSIMVDGLKKFKVLWDSHVSRIWS